MPRILHIADVHFDTPFACKAKSVRSALRKGVREAFTRAVDDAISSAVDAVLVAGDLFDDSRLRLETEAFLMRELSRLVDAGVTVVYSTGNHDPAIGNARAMQLEWPQGVIVAGSREPVETVVETENGPLRIVAAGHDSATVAENLVSRFPRFSDDIPTVGVLHANVAASVSGDQHRPYAPCTAEDLDSRGYAYWALGHIHVPFSPTPSRVAWYSGCLQGRHFREAGPRGGLLVDLGAMLPPEVTHRRYASVHWEIVELAEEGACRSLHALDTAARDAVKGIRAEYRDAELAVRFVLKGESVLWEQLRDESEDLAQRWAQDLGLLYAEVDAAQIHRPLDMTVLEAETTVLAEALGIVDELAKDEAGQLLAELVPEELQAASVLPTIEVGRLRRELAERFVRPTS